MAKAKTKADSNAVMWTVEQVCALYRVDVLRMQSRVLSVPGAAGRTRPMFFGKWRDHKGVEHAQGMADMLARPRVTIGALIGVQPPQQRDSFDKEICERILDRVISIPLWLEVKSGADTATYDQMAFRQYVEENGETYLLLHDSVDPLVQWFEKHGLKEGGR